MPVLVEEARPVSCGLRQLHVHIDFDLKPDLALRAAGEGVPLSAVVGRALEREVLDLQTTEGIAC